MSLERGRQVNLWPEEGRTAGKGEGAMGLDECVELRRRMGNEWASGIEFGAVGGGWVPGVSSASSGTLAVCVFTGVTVLFSAKFSGFSWLLVEGISESEPAACPSSWRMLVV